MIYNFVDNPLIIQLHSNYPVILNEYKHFISSSFFQTWPEHNLHNGKWNVFGFKYVGQRLELAHRLCPRTSKFLENFPSIITAGFSKLDPGCVIYPHVGNDSSVLRVHLGIDIPNGDCKLKVGKETINWGNGKVIVFDDTTIHEAWNKTSETRVVLLIDVQKDYFFS